MPNPTRLNEWCIEITNCAGAPMEIRLAAPESLSAQDVLVKLGAALDYPLEVLAERMMLEPGIVFTKTPPIELFQTTRYKIEIRTCPGCGLIGFNAIGDLRFTTEAAAEDKVRQIVSTGWPGQNLRVVIAND